MMLLLHLLLYDSLEEKALDPLFWNHTLYTGALSKILINFFNVLGHEQLQLIKVPCAACPLMPLTFAGGAE